MTRYRWRIRASVALLVSLIVATGVLTQAGAVSAAGTGTMESAFPYNDQISSVRRVCG